MGAEVSLSDDVNATLGAPQMVDQLRRIVAAYEKGLLRLNSRSVAMESCGARRIEYQMDTTEGRDSITATLGIRSMTVKYDHSISTSAEAVEAVDQLLRPDDGPTAADCAAKPFSASARPWMGIALNHDFSSNSIGRMRQVGLHIQVELFEPLTREQIFQIFGGAGISAHEIVGDKIKRFDILEFSFCPAAAAP